MIKWKKTNSRYAPRHYTWTTGNAIHSITLSIDYDDKQQWTVRAWERDTVGSFWKKVATQCKTLSIAKKKAEEYLRALPAWLVQY
jgi:hypothetical protein